MSDRASEGNVFKLFLKAAPEFSGERIREWSQPDEDPPDIICATASGRTIGIELGEWLNQEQMTEAKGRETVQDSILNAIGKQPDNDSENIYYIWMDAKPRARVKPNDVEAFRSQIFGLIANIDQRWLEESDWQSPQGLRYNDFSSFPVVGKYLDSITCFPRLHYVGWPPNGHMEKRQWPVGCDWLVFRFNGGAYSERSSLDALFNIIAKKITKYTAKPVKVQLDCFFLLIHYNQGLLYNTPLETLSFKYEDAARAASGFIADDPGAFQKIFLMLAIEPGQRIFQLYPS
jgi:hypothetical protein